MIVWTESSILDRAAALSGEPLGEPVVVLEVDTRSRFAGADGAPVGRPGHRLPEDVSIGAIDGVGWVARRVEEVTHAEPVGWPQATGPLVEAVATAIGLLAWHETNPACEPCGAVTGPDLGGRRRVCSHCGALAFPRQDPAVIMAILDGDDRLLLARPVGRPVDRWSLVAGFVEVGESAEQTCRREASEEVGVVLIDLRYVASQPWPMPRSFMLGFLARARDPDVVPDGVEIAEVSWWAADDYRAAVATGRLARPSAASLAKVLIDAWLDGARP